MRSVIGTLIFSALLTASYSLKANDNDKASNAEPEVEKGKAAFYGHRFEGHKTACGVTYVATQMTTAHRTLPCNTKVRITNIKNGKSVEATVTDRGPTSRKRIADVSRAVAEELDFVKQGITTVEIQVVK